eukprot:TRINITY_DN2668_c0_g1_i2.p1 TRINITY_DN2668_c0_g1~~TRINITY_DN2668_c0_g1_i2.p1  ORF type:complete len:114 (-),score=12.25 TRINITY_DN2668_c0_g1_i2:505-846(-)
MDEDILLPKDILAYILNLIPGTKIKDITEFMYVSKWWKLVIDNTPSLYWYKHLPEREITRKYVRSYHDKAIFYAMFLPYEIQYQNIQERMMDCCCDEHPITTFKTQKYYYLTK